MAAVLKEKIFKKLVINFYFPFSTFYFSHGNFWQYTEQLAFLVADFVTKPAFILAIINMFGMELFAFFDFYILLKAYLLNKHEYVYSLYLNIFTEIYFSLFEIDFIDGITFYNYELKNIFFSYDFFQYSVKILYCFQSIY